jgi:hypothetical protein
MVSPSTGSCARARTKAYANDACAVDVDAKVIVILLIPFA